MKTLLPDQPSKALVGSHVSATADDALYLCVLCHRDAWISRGGQERLRRFPLTKVVCLLCYLEGSLDDEPPVMPDENTLLQDVGEVAERKIRKRYGHDE